MVTHREPGDGLCQEMSTLPAGYIPQRKVTLASSSGLLCIKCCRMVDSVLSILVNTVRPSVDRRSNDTTFGAGTFSWQDPVHSWKAGPGEVMTVEKLRYAPKILMVDRVGNQVMIRKPLEERVL